MIKDSDRTLVEQFKRLMIEHGVPLYKTIVFGSRARGDAEPDSDLDVLVLVEHLDPTMRKIISHCAWEVGFEVGILIQAVVMTRDEAEHGPERKRASRYESRTCQGSRSGTDATSRGMPGGRQVPPVRRPWRTDGGQSGLLCCFLCSARLVANCWQDTA